MSKNRRITEIAMIIAIYNILIFVVPSVSFGPIQFRIAELLNFLVIINPLYAIGVSGGVFLSNLFFGGGPIDAFFGTIHTGVSFLVIIYLMKLTKSKVFHYLFVVLTFSSLMFIIAYEICLLQNDLSTFWPMYGTLFLSEVVVLSLGSFIMYRFEKIWSSKQ